MALDSLILLRHGVTDWNASSRMQGHRDIPLNDDGRAQARAAGPSVAALRPDVLISSDLRRAIDTAEILAPQLGLLPSRDARLRETSLGEWEGLTRSEVQQRWPDQWEAWRHRGVDIAPPGGESRMEVAARSAELVSELDDGPSRTALLVTHGGLIVGLTGRLLELQPRTWSNLVGISNCHWVALHRVNATWRLHTYNGGLGGVVRPHADEDIIED